MIKFKARYADGKCFRDLITRLQMIGAWRPTDKGRDWAISVTASWEDCQRLESVRDLIEPSSFDTLMRAVTPATLSGPLLRYWASALRYSDIGQYDKVAGPKPSGHEIRDGQLSRKDLDAFRAGHRSDDAYRAGLVIFHSKSNSIVAAFGFEVDVATGRLWPTASGCLLVAGRHLLIKGEEPSAPILGSDKDYSAAVARWEWKPAVPYKAPSSRRQLPGEETDDPIERWRSYLESIDGTLMSLGKSAGLPRLSLESALYERDADIRLNRIVPLNDSKAISAASAALSESAGASVSPRPLVATLRSYHAGADAGQNDERGDLLTGHMSAEFGLDPSQRRATLAFLATGEGLLAVPGPPGTGKTTMLRSCVASLVVDAAAAGKSVPPLIVGCSQTNQAVRNIIEAFARIAGPAGGGLASRWIESFPSYGWFLPSRRSVENPDDAVHSQQAVLLAKGDLVASELVGSVKSAPNPMRVEPPMLGEMRSLWLGRFADWNGPQTRVEVEDIGEALETLKLALQDNLLRQRAAVAASPILATVFAGGAGKLAVDAVREQRIALQTALRPDGSVSVRAADRIVALEQALAGAAKPTGLWPRLREAIMDRLDLGIPELEPLAELVGRAGRVTRHDRTSLITSGLELKRTATLRRDRVVVRESAADRKRAERAAEVVLSIAKYRKYLDAVSDFAAATGQSNDGPAIESVAGIGVAPAQSVLASNHDGLARLIDVGLRAEAFHLAMRYFEGQFLLQAGVAPDGVVGALGRLSLIGPVLVATTTSLPRILEGFGDADDPPVDVLIIDEAGQLSTHQAGPVLVLARSALIVGDERQISPIDKMDPTIAMKLAVEAGLKISEGGDRELELLGCGGSLMSVASRASSFHDEPGRKLGVTLRYHYRCPPSVIRYCNDLVYARVSELIPVLPEPVSLPLPTFGFVTGETNAISSAGSWKCQLQANQVIDWIAGEGAGLAAALSPDPANPRTIGQTIAVVTPFAAHRDLLIAVAKERLGDHGLVIGTAHALQGAERPVVVFCVPVVPRQSSMMDRDAGLLNVAVSRAQKSFVLFCDPAFLAVGFTAPDRRSAVGAPSVELARAMVTRGTRVAPRELVIVESPKKASTLQEALGPSSTVISTNGNFRGCAAYPTAAQPQWTLSDTGVRMVAAATGFMKMGAGHYDRIVVASDPDEAGEEIAWHVREVLAELPGYDAAKLRRVRLDVLNRDAFRETVERSTPELDMPIVRARLARRWADGISAKSGRLGRVHGATLDLIRTESVRLKDRSALGIKPPGDHRVFWCRQDGAFRPAVPLGPTTEGSAIQLRRMLEWVVKSSGASIDVTDIPMSRRVPAIPIDTWLVCGMAADMLDMTPDVVMKALQTLWEAKA